MDLVWEALTPKAIGEVEKGDFELLCRALLEVECSDRHGQASRVDGPEAADTPDGGRDLLVVVSEPPSELAEAYARRYQVRPLTPDQGRCAFSCKTGKNWQKTVLAEAGKTSERVIPILRAGGSLTIFVNVPFTTTDDSSLEPAAQPNAELAKAPMANAKSKKPATKANPISSAAKNKTLIDKLADAYAARMPNGDPTADELGERIRIIDANTLHQFLCGRRPVLPPRMAKALGLHSIGYLQDIDNWWQFHENDRHPAPHFVPDEQRARLRDQIVHVLTSRAPDPYDRALWIVGAPGIGKTRLVLEALRGDERLKRRALVALSHVEGLRAIREDRIAEQFGAVVLVIDDCPAHAVAEIEPYLPKLGRDKDAALLVITPHALDALPPTALHLRIEVDRLERDATATIIRGQLGQGAEREVVDRLASLAEGYPWFAALVAVEMAQGAPPPKTVAEAADLALASLKEEGARFADVVIDNARALFAVILTEDVDWSELRDEEKSALSAAVGARSWERLLDARGACERRKLLRVRAAGKFTYVTPEILAREVVRKLLLTPPPRGPRERPRLERVPAWSTRFYERLERLGLSREELGVLAQEVLTQVDNAGPGLAAFGPTGVSGPALLFAAQYLPSKTCVLLRRRIKEASIDELRTRRDVRRHIVWALERGARRGGSFDDAETALFLLAVAENEAYANNATSTWSSLFLIPVNLTGRPWADRISRLAQRCRDDSAERRRTALVGVGAAVSTQPVFLADGEGPLKSLTLEEARQARVDAWFLLIACALDEDANVGREARKLIGRWLRGAVREGLLDRFAAELISALPRFDEASMREVREAIDHIETYERDGLERSPTLREALSRVAQATIPHSFAERFHQQVGTWGPSVERSTDETRDEELIREGLSLPDRPLLAEVDWLLSNAAVRSASFAITLGRVDVDHILLEPLVERTRAGAAPMVLSRYCIGMDGAGRGAELDGLVARWNDDPALLEVAALSLTRLDPNDPRPAVLASAVEHGLVPERALWALTWHSWAAQLSPSALARLLAALLAQPSAAAATAALELVLDRLEAHPQEQGLRDPLLRAMDRLSREVLVGMPAYAWERGGKRILEMGAVREACACAVRGVLASEQLASDHHWTLVRACEKHSPAELWEAVRAVLEQGGPPAVHLAIDLRWQGVGARFSADRVLEWVGYDRVRAGLVVQFAPVHADALSDLTRGLISRFGAESAEAHELASAVGSTFKAVSSLAEHDRKQLAHVQRWRADADAEVRRWADSLAESLKRSEEFHDAYEEHERRRFGT